MVPSIPIEERLPEDEARLVRMLKALSNPVRFRIMQTLAERRACITQELVETTPLAQSTVSQHLKVLREAGLIQGEIEGPATCYCISPQAVTWLKEQVARWLPDCCEPSARLNLEPPLEARGGGLPLRLVASSTRDLAPSPNPDDRLDAERARKAADGWCCWV